MKNEIDVRKFLDILHQDPRSRVFVIVADLYRRVQRFQDAIILCENGIKHNQDFASGHLILGRVHYDMADFVRAKNTLARVLEITPDNIIALALTGEISLREKNVSLAKNIYRKLMLLSPRENVAKQFIENFTKFTKEVKINSNGDGTQDSFENTQIDRPIFFTKSLAMIYEKQGLINEAINIYTKIVENNPQDREAIQKITTLHESLPFPVKRVELPNINRDEKIDEEIRFLKDLLVKISSL